MVTIIICAVLAVVGFFSGYIYRAFKTERISFLPAGQPDKNVDDVNFMLDEPISRNRAKCLKKGFKDKFPGQTETIIHEYGRLKEYINVTLKKYFDENTGNPELTNGVAFHLGFTKDAALRGKRKNPPEIPANRITVFLAPVKYSTKERNPGDPVHKLDIVKHYIEDLTLPPKYDCKKNLETLLPEVGDEDDALLDDIAHTEP
jgi:hypothetical protein